VVAFVELQKQARRMIDVHKVREGEQINVLCYSHDKLVVFWLFCIEQKNRITSILVKKTN